MVGCRHESRRDCILPHGDPMLGEFADAVVLFKAGEVPDDATVS
jgi:hypothetical protein